MSGGKQLSAPYPLPLRFMLRSSAGHRLLSSSILSQVIGSALLGASVFGGTMGVLLAAGGCSQTVSLGGWDEPAASDSATTDPAVTTSAPTVEPTAPSDDAGGASSDAGEGLGHALPQCLQAADSVESSAPGLIFSTNEVSSEWNLAGPVPSLSWTLMVERDVNQRPDGTPTNGYYWHQRFSFEAGIVGRFGIQTQGIYQPDPPDPDSVITKMAVLWLSGTPLASELGDIPYPDARIAPAIAGGLTWVTIHALFPWEECHVYQFHLRLESTEADGAMWYGAWINDLTDGQELLLGRVLLPADSGLLSRQVISRTSPIARAASSCAQLEPSSAIFGAPTAGDEQAAHADSRFSEPLGCVPSSVGLFPGAVRHEFGASL